MKKFSIVLNIFLFILFSISLFFVFHRKSNENNEKYEISVSTDSTGSNYLTLIDKNTKEDILLLGYGNDNEIKVLILYEHNGFRFILGREDNKIIQYAITDTNSDYHNLTIFNVTYVDEEQETLVNRYEQYNKFSKLYKLFDDGKTELLDWDINSEN